MTTDMGEIQEMLEECTDMDDTLDDIRSACVDCRSELNDYLDNIEGAAEEIQEYLGKCVNLLLRFRRKSGHDKLEKECDC